VDRPRVSRIDLALVLEARVSAPELRGELQSPAFPVHQTMDCQEHHEPSSTNHEPAVRLDAASVDFLRLRLGGAGEYGLRCSSRSAWSIVVAASDLGNPGLGIGRRVLIRRTEGTCMTVGGDARIQAGGHELGQRESGGETHRD
jgi:hypothetical protein